MRRNAIQLSRRHRLVLYVSTLALLATGAVWAWLHYFHRIEGEFGPEFSPAEPWLLKIHGAFAMVSLLVIGSLLTVHVKRGWQAGLNRGSGVGLLTTFGVLTATGYGLYYFSDEKLRGWTSNIHLWIGLALPLVLLAHLILGHRTRRLLHRQRQAQAEHSPVSSAT